MKTLLLNFYTPRLKPYRFSFNIMILFLLFSVAGCDKEDSSGPSIKGFLNGTEVKEIKVTAGTTVNFKYEIQSSSPLSKVEVFVRTGIGLGTDSQLFTRKEAVAGDLEGNSYTVEGTLTATTDLMISAGAIDADGNITTLQLNALLDVSEFDDLILMDAKANGTSKTFCNTQYGLLLFAANTAADPAAVDFGFIYMESTADVKASLVSFSDFGKTGTYPVVGAKNVTQFKKAQAYGNTNAAIQAAFASGTNYPSVLGIEAGRAATNLKDGDVIAFKTQQGKSGLILVKTVDRKNEAASSEQTIKFKMVVQK
jgi:hypothetical protein